MIDGYGHCQRKVNPKRVLFKLTPTAMLYLFSSTFLDVFNFVQKLLCTSVLGVE